MTVHAQKAQLVEEACRTTLACTSTDPAFHLLIALVTGLLTLAVVASVLHLRDALTLVDEERSHTAAERDALENFAREVAALDPTAEPAAQSVSASGAPVMTQARTIPAEPPPNGDLDTVASAYRNTLMAVPHYADEYDESLAENMAAEFGQELAAAVVDGSQLTPGLQTALINQSQEAKERRDRLIHALDRETDELEDAHDSLSSMNGATEELTSWLDSHRSFDELSQAWESLHRLEQDCSRLLTHRQERLQTGILSGHSRKNAPSLQEYLYGSLPVSYPVLAEGTALADRIQTAQRHVLDQLTRRV